MKVILLLLVLTMISSIGQAEDKALKPNRKPASGELFCYVPGDMEATVSYVGKDCDKEKPFSITALPRDPVGAFLVCCSIKK